MPDKRPHLPKLYHRIHRHLVEKGMSESHAWAVTVNMVRKGCLEGDLNFKGIQQMSKPKRAEWCKAYAEYKKSHPGTSAKGLAR